MYRYIYKITCTQDVWKDHYYLGKHKTENLEDNYKGCGSKLKYYFDKYPNDYVKEIISFADSDEELNKMEYDIIHKNIYNPLCLNIMEGGFGGMSIGRAMSDKTKNRISESLKEYFAKNGSPKKGKKMSEEQRQKLLDSWKTRSHTLSEETRRKMSESHKGKKNTPEHNKHISEARKKNIN